MAHSNSFSTSLVPIVVAALLSGCGGLPEPESPAAPGEADDSHAIPIAEEPEPEPARADQPVTPRKELAEPARETDADCCRGRNDCKGLGGCAVAGANDCRGKNECKGLGGCQAHCPE